jgi:hypothetical protein
MREMEKSSKLVQPTTLSTDKMFLFISLGPGLITTTQVLLLARLRDLATRALCCTANTHPKTLGRAASYRSHL